ncbi:hypothetical protein Tco_0401527 [Tanacetum coccineum]
MIKSLIDDFPPLDIFGGNFVTLSNPLSDSNEDFTSSDDESPPEADVSEENFKIYSNPLFEFDEGYISSDVNPLFNKVLEDIENAFLAIDASMDIEDGYHDSEGDIIYLERLLLNDSIPNLLPEVFLDHDPRSLKDEPDNDDLKSKVKVFDLGVHETIISMTYVRLPFEDFHCLSLTFVIKIFLPFLTYLVNSLFLLSSGNKDTIFDPDIPAYSFYSLELVSYESLMKDCSDYKDLVLVVLSIVHSSFYPLHAYIWESDILDLID